MNARSVAFDTALRVLDEGVQRHACQWVAERLERMGDHAKEVLPSQIASDLNVKSEAGMRDVLKALDILSLNSIGVLQVAYELYESEGVMAMPTDVSGEDVLHALKTGQLVSPTTGMPVLNFAKHLAVVYRVRAIAA